MSVDLIPPLTGDQFPPAGPVACVCTLVWPRPVYRVHTRPVQSQPGGLCLSQSGCSCHPALSPLNYQVMPGGIKIVNEANLSCQHNLDTMERQDLLSGRTFINLDNSGWSGGVATVVPQVARMDKVEAGARMKEEQELDPDEEEKRRVRRERNKLAAARCRKRRVEQIEGLQVSDDNRMENISVYQV